MNEACGRCANRNIYAVCFNCKGGSNYAPLEQKKKSTKDCFNCMHKDSRPSAEPCESCTIRGNEPPTNWEQEETPAREEMTLERAIFLLDPATTGAAIAEIEYYRGFNGKAAAIEAIRDAIEMACKAMRKQLPRYPAYEHGEWFCRACGAPVDGENGYCGQCGQAYEWGE